MQNKIAITLLFFALSYLVKAQFPDSLKTIRVYGVATSASTDENGKTNYEINGKKASKSEYEKYSNDAEFSKCCPCIIEYVNIKGEVEMKAVSCTDCIIGYFEVYEKGKMAMQGQYKDTRNSGNNCSEPHGEFRHFEDGEYRYSEYWENGVFVKQSPQQSQPEIWKFQLAINDSLNVASLDAESFKNMTYDIGYKNDQRYSSLSVHIIISSYPTKVDTIFDISEIKDFTEDKIHAYMANNVNPNALCQLEFYGDGTSIWTFIYSIKLPHVNTYNTDTLIRERVLNKNMPLMLVRGGTDKRRIILKENWEYEIEVQDPLDNLDSDFTLHTYTGGLRGVKDNLLLVQPSVLNTWIYNDSLSSETETYFNERIGGEFATIPISLNEVQSVSFRTPLQNVSHSTGMTILGVSLTSALVIAPLMSYSFKTKEFNSERYLKWTGCSLMGVAVSIPLSIYGRSRKYEMHEWYFME